MRVVTRSAGQTMNCTNCGTPIAKDTRFCHKCGEPVPGAPKSAEPGGRRTMMELLKAETQGVFEIERELGRGGMSIVFLATELKLGRKVAIKVLPPEFTFSQGSERFLREAQIAASLQHPNIIPIYRVESSGSLCWFTMPVVEGKSLEQVIEAEGRLTLARTMRILRQVASALDYAHERSVVHRDVKPANVLLLEGSEDRVVVTDFGIARAFGTDSNITGSGFIIGTPSFMSPEQASGGAVSGASDQYSVAVMAYLMLSGRLPFEGRSAMEVLQKLAVASPQPLDELVPDLPNYVARAIARSLAKAAGGRFPSVSALVESWAGEEIAEMRFATKTRLSKRDYVLPDRPLILRARGSGFTHWLAELWARWFGHPTPPTVEVSPKEISISLMEMEPDDQFSFSSALDQASSASNSTQILKPEDWAPAPEAPGVPGRSETQILRAGKAGAPLGSVQVALVVNAAPDPRLSGTRVRCTRFPFTVGRAATADFSIAGDIALSRTHLQIDVDDKGFVIRDLSANGVFVNGRHVRGGVEPLFFGVTIQLSNATSLTFVADTPRLPDLAGQVVAGRYRLKEQIHESVRAATYTADDDRLSHAVVIKIFSPSLMRLAQYRDDFRREAALAARLHHPHIRKVIDFGEATVSIDDSPVQTAYLCNEFMEGGNLTARLESGSPATLAEVSGWIAKVAAALDYAHRHDVVHGDLKPNCIVFDGDGTPYLTDFVLPRAGESAGRSIVGAPDFLAPEQWAGDPATPATDQYSLAMLTYLMVTGSRPYQGQADPETRSRNFHFGPPPAQQEAERRGRPPVPSALAGVLGRAMSLKPEDRFPSIVEFSNAVAEVVSHPYRRGPEPRVFLSYQRQASAGWANLFAKTLKEQHGYSVFIDTQARDGAPQIPDRLREEILAADVFICLLAPGTLTSTWVQAEVTIAYEAHRPMVPIFHEDYQPAKEDMRSLPSVATLLNCDAVHLLDRRNIHIEHTITELAERIRDVGSTRQEPGSP